MAADGSSEAATEGEQMSVPPMKPLRDTIVKKAVTDANRSVNAEVERAIEAFFETTAAAERASQSLREEFPTNISAEEEADLTNLREQLKSTLAAVPRDSRAVLALARASRRKVRDVAESGNTDLRDPTQPGLLEKLEARYTPTEENLRTALEDSDQNTLNQLESLLADVEGDVEVEVSGGSVSLQCPITQQRFKDPARSATCGHTYEREAALAHYRRNRLFDGTAKCPVAGCPHKFQPNDLQRDEMMAARLRMTQQ